MDETLLTSAATPRKLTLVLGGPGTGKTRRVLEELCKAASSHCGWHALDKPLHTLIVPEQQTLLLEHEVATCLGPTQLLTARTGVVSFGQLARRWGFRNAEPSPVQLLTTLLGRSTTPHRLAFCDQLLPLVRELLADGTTVEELETLAQYAEETGCKPGLVEQLRELQELYAAVAPGHPTAVQPLCVRDLAQLAGGEIWIDGFAGFTAQEYRLLEELFASGLRGITCTLLIDEDPAIADRYQPARTTRDQLTAMAGRHSRGVETVVLSDSYRPAAGCRVATVECANRLAEADFTARKIVELTRATTDSAALRYSAITVAVPSIEQYRDLLEIRLTDYGIPVYIDERVRLSEHGLVSWFRSAIVLALELCLPGLASPADIAAWLAFDWPRKILGREEQWRLEQYARERGLSPLQWLQPESWHRSPELGELQPVLFGPVLELATLLPSCRSAAEALEAAWDCLLMGWELDEEQRRAVEAIAALIDALKQLASPWVIDLQGRMGAEHGLTPGELVWFLGQLLDSLSLGQTPQQQDAVMVTDILRGRHASPQVTFLLGMDEGSWPLPAPAEPVFSLADRAQLVAAWRRGTAGAVPWMPLRERSRDFCDMRPYLALVAESRPSQALFALCPAAETARDTLTPSSYFCSLAEQATERLTHGLTDFTLPAWCRSELDLSLTRALANPVPDQVWSTLPALRDHLARHDGTLRLSPTQLETMAACPAKHFIRYALHLNEESEDSFGRRELGSAYHSVLQGLGRSLVNTSGLDTVGLRERARTLIAEHLPELAASSGRARTSYVGRRLELLIAERLNWLRLDGEGEYAVLGVEVDLDRNALGLRPYQVPRAAAPTVVSGRIDRIDVNRSGAHRLVDYKLSKATLDWRRFASGLQQQLLLYLLALVQSHRHRQLSPAGAWYQPLEPQRHSQGYALTPTALGYANYGLAKAVRDRLADGTLLRWTMQASEGITHELCRWIEEGVIAPQPLTDRDWSACAMCDYRAICRFEASAMHHRREIPPLNVRDLLNAIADGSVPAEPLPPPPLLAAKGEIHA